MVFRLSVWVFVGGFAREIDHPAFPLSVPEPEGEILGG
jgi:hypothetical protein